MPYRAYASTMENAMPNPEYAAGRLVPVSALDFARYAKNLAWLIEVPLHLARDMLAAMYGYGSLHELEAILTVNGEKQSPLGPFDEPRKRPPFFQEDQNRHWDTANNLTPLTGRERKLLRFSENVLYRRPEKDGRLRRRHYAVLDAAFFSSPSVHRKRFAEVKAGILAMELGGTAREHYLERHWPPAFWSYLEATHQLHFDPLPALEELKDSSIYYDASHVLSIAGLLQNTAAYRAPAIFLAMAGEDPEPHAGLSDIKFSDLDDDNRLPYIGSECAGLFEDWDIAICHDVISEYLDDDELTDQIFDMTLQELVANPPDGTPEAVVIVARKWRLHQLRSRASAYVNSEDDVRRFARQEEAFWPDSAGNTVTEVSELVWQISRDAPSLLVYSAYEERCRSDDTHDNRQFWAFKALLTRVAPGEEEDVVGYMTGWLFVPATEQYVCDQDDLLADVSHCERLLRDGVTAFIKSYLPYNGFDDLLSFVNSRFTSNIAITEIVLREKYRNKKLSTLAFEAFVGSHQNAPYSDLPAGWLEWADFDLESDADIIDREADVDVLPPGVFMIPAQRTDKKLRSILAKLNPKNPIGNDIEPLDVFPFHYEKSAENDANI